MRIRWTTTDQYEERIRELEVIRKNKYNYTCKILNEENYKGTIKIAKNSLNTIMRYGETINKIEVID